MGDYWKEVEAAAKAPGLDSKPEEFLVPTNKTLLRKTTSAAAWLWVIAAVSTINLGMAYGQAPLRFVAGLFITELAFEAGRSVGPIFTAMALVADVIVIGCVVFVGFQIRANQAWAFFAGIVTIILDAIPIYFLTRLEVGLWPFLFHGLPIYSFVVGLGAAKILRERKSKGQV